jgi:hypothetical protein
MKTNGTAGQNLTDTLRKMMHIGPRTRQFRKHPLIAGKQNVNREVIEIITNSNNYPGYYPVATSDILNAGRYAVSSWDKHVDGYRINATQRAYLTSLSPWDFTALLGEMTDAGITNTGEGERWFAARCGSDVAAWDAR